MSHVLAMLLSIVVLGIAYLIGYKVVGKVTKPIEHVYISVVGFGLMLLIFLMFAAMYGFYTVMHSIMLSVI